MDPSPSAAATLAALDGERLAVLVLAPQGRDAPLVARALDGAALDVVTLDGPAALCRALGRDDVGAVVLTGEALALPGLGGVAEALAGEPDWSELPFLLFVSPGWGTRDYLGVMARLGRRRNVTVLERPVRPVAFRSVVEMAVDGRRQQHRVRDLLAEVRALNGGLQARVEGQTAALRARAEQVEALARLAAEAERRERERIAQLLHDDLQQLLYGLKIHVGILAARADAPDDLAARVEGYVDDAIAQARLLATELHPSTLADDGIAAALGWVADFARQRHGLTVHLDVIDGVDVPAAETLALFTRAARELLFNVVKHAGTGEAWVRAWCDAEGCHLRVRDAGCGFAALGDGTGLGLAEIEHRVVLAGGHVDVESTPGEGTVVDVMLPG